MDDSGRLHMPGFVGQTFEETGLKKKANGSIIDQLAGDNSADEGQGPNRAERRRLEAIRHLEASITGR